MLDEVDLQLMLEELGHSLGQDVYKRQQYKGETTVTPRTYEETRLETKDKLMPDDAVSYTHLWPRS